MYRLAPNELVGRPKILHQDAPGDTVDGQVVNDEQQAARLMRTQVEKDDAQERPLQQVQTGLQFGGRRLKAVLPRLRQCRQITPRRDSVTGPALNCCQPDSRAKPQAERIVVQEQVLQGLPHQSRVQGLLHFQQDRLVVVVGVSKMLLEEPPLYGRKRHHASHRTLFGLDRRGRASRRQLGDRLVLKQLFGGEAKPRLIGSGDNLNAEDRIPAQLEEVVMDTDPFEPQDSAQISASIFSTGVEGPQRSLSARAWLGQVRAVPGGPPCRGALAARRPRPRRPRHHVVRQFPLKEVA